VDYCPLVELCEGEGAALRRGLADREAVVPEVVRDVDRLRAAELPAAPARDLADLLAVVRLVVFFAVAPPAAFFVVVLVRFLVDAEAAARVPL
jgi:hypothetical protein